MSGSPTIDYTLIVVVAVFMFLLILFVVFLICLRESIAAFAQFLY